MSETGKSSRLSRFLDSDFFFDFRHAPVTIIASVVVALLIFVAVLAPFVAPTNPFDPTTINLMNGFTPPMDPNAFTGEVFLLGTDDQGRDLLSGIIYGLRISLFVGLMSVLLAMGIGVSLGLLAGYVGGCIDNIIMRCADIQMTFPSILIAMLIFGVMRGVIPPDLRDEMAVVVLILAVCLTFTTSLCLVFALCLPIFTSFDVNYDLFHIGSTRHSNEVRLFVRVLNLADLSRF